MHTAASSAFAVVADNIRTRRTIKDFTGAPLSRDEITTLLELATWAPTHRLTEPWRFYVLDQAAIVRLMDFLRAEPAIAAVPDPAKGSAKLAKLCERLPSLGALVQVTWKRDAKHDIDLEEHAAASAAVQNLLLVATAQGLGSFWSSNPALAHPLTLRWCGSDPASEGFLGSIWLGHPAMIPPSPPRQGLRDRIRWL